jgi:hypothetical protein
MDNDPRKMELVSVNAKNAERYVEKLNQRRFYYDAADVKSACLKLASNLSAKKRYRTPDGFRSATFG